MASKHNEAAEQAWPSFVDILSSTVLVLCFALLVLVIVLSVARVTSSIREESDESSPSAFRVESEVLGEFRAEFQKVAIIANPSLRKEMEIESVQPSTDEPQIPIYAPVESQVVEDPQEIIESGDSQRQVLGDIPKTIDARAVEVLKELIIVQRDVIEQLRKVIEQLNTEVQETVREYQSLLALVTQAPEVEDIRQKIVPKNEQAMFADTDMAGERLTGASENPLGNSYYMLKDPYTSTKDVTVQEMATGFHFNFYDNSGAISGAETTITGELKSPDAKLGNYNIIENALRDRVEEFKASGVIIEVKPSDLDIIASEAGRNAIDRLLIVKDILNKLGVPTTSMTLRMVSSDDETAEENQEQQEEDYGWINVKAKD